MSSGKALLQHELVCDTDSFENSVLLHILNFQNGSLLIREPAFRCLHVITLSDSQHVTFC